jgi:hypothetical protein
VREQLEPVQAGAERVGAQRADRRGGHATPTRPGANPISDLGLTAARHHLVEADAAEQIAGFRVGDRVRHAALGKDGGHSLAEETLGVSHRERGRQRRQKPVAERVVVAGGDHLGVVRPVRSQPDAATVDFAKAHVPS